MGPEKKYFSGNISGASVTGNMTAAYFSGRLNIPSGKSGGNYEELSNKPRINGVELLGDRSFSELGFTDIPDMTGYAKLSDIPSKLPADGGDADTVGGHTVMTDVPENAVFTDTVPDLSGYAKITDIPSSLPANGGNADSADTLTDWGTRIVTDANDAPFGFCAALDCENTPNTFWSTILTTGSSGATKYKTQIAFPWAFGVGENKIRYRCENNGEWGSWQEISTTPIKSEVMSVSTDSSGNSVIFDAVENKKIISINCFAKQAVPFNYNNKQYGHFTENDGSPYVGSASFTVYYIEG